jgi:hypothetical protein
LGRRRRFRRDRGARRGSGGGRHLLRHGGCLWRRPQRDDDRSLAGVEPGFRSDRGDQAGSPPRSGARELLSGELPCLGRSLPCKPRRRHPRPRAVALPADSRLLDGSCLRRPRCPRRRRVDRGLWRERRDGRRSSHGDRSSASRERSDHSQCIPVEAARRRAARGDRCGRRHHRARAPCEWTALRPLLG